MLFIGWEAMPFFFFSFSLFMLLLLVFASLMALPLPWVRVSVDRHVTTLCINIVWLLGVK